MDVIKKTGVSKGQTSKVFNWLQENHFIEKIQGKYHLKAAASLFSLFPLYRKMKNTQIGSFSIRENPEAVKKALIKRGTVFCLSTALQEYSSYYQDPNIHAYSDDKELLEELATSQKGLTQVNIYKPDLSLDIDIEKKGKGKFTGPVRTIIDLYCSNQAYTTKELIERLYQGERID